MSNSPRVLVVKESREGETRVSLVPADVDKLIQDGFSVFIEDQAGVYAGYDNKAYEMVGAKICKIQNEDVESYRAIFKNIDFIIRVKRPDRAREKIEALAIPRNTKMIGSLDLLEKNSEHVKEYHQAGIEYYSFDQFHFPPDSPMDAFKKMSTFAGKLAVEDAIQKKQGDIQKVIVIGYGEAGQAAFLECLSRGLSCTVITSQQRNVAGINSQGGNAVYVSREIPLVARQENIKKLIKDADIIITAASSNGVVAPILVPNETLQELKPGTVIVDLSLTEGGNVEGSQHDATLILGNKVYVTNVSGYPKSIPVEASIEWSKASFYFLNILVKTPELLQRR